MKSVLVVAGSSANIPPELVNEMDIRVFSLLLNRGGEVLRDGEEITISEFYNKQREGKLSARTSSPSVADFFPICTSQTRLTGGIVSVHLPAQLSSMLEIIRTASRLVDNVAIEVLDARSVAIAHGFVVIESVRAAKEGQDMQQVVQRGRQVADKVRFFAMLDNLEFLFRGGRIGVVRVLMGMLLSIKPIVYLVEGRVEVPTITRNKKKARDRMIELIEEKSLGKSIHGAVFHTDELEQARSFHDRIIEYFDCKELFITEPTPVMGVHSRPDVLGVAFFPE